MRKLFILIVLFGACAATCLAKGGPTLLTDDPGTPGNHNVWPTIQAG